MMKEHLEVLLLKNQLVKQQGFHKECENNDKMLNSWCTRLHLQYSQSTIFSTTCTGDSNITSASLHSGYFLYRCTFIFNLHQTKIPVSNVLLVKFVDTQTLPNES